MPEDLSLARPPSLTSDTTTTASGPRAGFWQRLLASVVDGLLFAAMALAATLMGWDKGSLAYQAGTTAVSLVYFAYFEGRASGQTPGKALAGIRVMDFETGAPLGFGRAALRFLARALSAFAVGLGYLWMLWDPERRTWHDKLTDAVVVPVADYPVEREP